MFNVSNDSIRNWENNKAVPQIQFLPKITEFLGYLPISGETAMFGDKLKLYRHINGLSQKELGRRLNVDGGTVCCWELGKNLPHEETRQKIDSLLEKMEDQLLKRL